MENEMKNSYYNGYSKGLGFGVVLVLIGIMFLGFNFGFLPEQLKQVVFTWPMILIAISIVHFFKHKVFSAIMLAVVGSFFLIPKIIHAYPDYFPGVDASFTHTFWPLLLIAAGLIMILSKLLGPKWGFNEFHHNHNQKHSNHYSKYAGTSGGFSKNSVFGSGEHIVLDPEFKGGELNAVFGGITLDLRKTNLPEGDTRLELNAVFGGITVLVPNTWLVETHLDAVFGGFEDKRFKVDSIDASRKLVITGACVFGGGELRN